MQNLRKQLVHVQVSFCIYSCRIQCLVLRRATHFLVYCCIILSTHGRTNDEANFQWKANLGQMLYTYVDNLKDAKPTVYVVSIVSYKCEHKLGESVSAANLIHNSSNHTFSTAYGERHQQGGRGTNFTINTALLCSELQSNLSAHAHASFCGLCCCGIQLQYD